MGKRIARSMLRVGLWLAVGTIAGGAFASGGVIALAGKLSGELAFVSAAKAKAGVAPGDAMLIMQHALAVKHEHALWHR